MIHYIYSRWIIAHSCPLLDLSDSSETTSSPRTRIHCPLFRYLSKTERFISLYCTACPRCAKTCNMHTRQQKIKLCRSGPSLLRKTLALGEKANVFSLAVYHNATYNRLEAVVHLPEGEKIPDVNRLVRNRKLLYCLGTLVLSIAD